ncbi:hypothetical protein D3C84_868130 [compost metagenome]
MLQALAAQHQVQRVIPGHILQTQSHLALHRITGHQVDPGKVGQHLQHRAYLDILEIQRQRLTAVQLLPRKRTGRQAAPYQRGNNTSLAHR